VAGPHPPGTAILFATITNIVAYAPFLMLSGGTGDFIYSLPVVLACALVASRITSMTFIPLLGYYLLRPSARQPSAAGRKRGAVGAYYRVVGALIEHRWLTVGAAMVLLLVGGFGVRGSRPSSSRRTCRTSHTWTSGCRRTRPSPPPTRCRSRPRRWCAR